MNRGIGVALLLLAIAACGPEEIAEPAREPADASVARADAGTDAGQPDAGACVPNCAGRVCGSGEDGCGGVCGAGSGCTYRGCTSGHGACVDACDSEIIECQSHCFTELCERNCCVATYGGMKCATTGCFSKCEQEEHACCRAYVAAHPGDGCE